MIRIGPVPIDYPDRSHQAAGHLGPRILEPHLTLRVAVQDALTDGVPVWAFRTADRRLRADWQRLSETLLGIA